MARRKRRYKPKPASYQWMYAPRDKCNIPRRFIAVYCRRGRLLEMHKSDGEIKALLSNKRYNNIGRLPTVKITVEEYIRWQSINTPDIYGGN